MRITKRKMLLAAVAFAVLVAVIYLMATSDANAQTPAANTPGAVDAPSSDADAPKSETSPQTPEPGATPKSDSASETPVPGDSEKTPIAIGRPNEGQPLKQDQPAESKPGFGGVAVELFLYLGAIVGLIILILLFLKKILPGSHRIFQSKVVDVIGRTYLAPKQGLFLVRLADRILVLGVTGSSINVLTEITEPDEVAKIRELSAHTGHEGVSAAFKSIFSRKRREFETGFSDQEAPAANEELNKIKSMISNWKEKYAEGSTGG